MPNIEACKKATFACKTSSPLLLNFHLQGLFCEQARTVQHGATVAAHERGLTERFLRVPLVQLSQLHRCHSSRCSTNGVTSARNKEIAREASIGRQ